MFFKLLIIFTIIPALEMVLLLKVGSIFGFLGTVFIIISTGMLGAALAKQQGLQTMFKIQQAINNGKVPTVELVDGFLILIAGVLLITPGLLTDATGFLLLIPAFRAVIRKHADIMFKNKVTIVGSQYGAPKRPSQSSADVIDVEAKSVKEDK